MSKVGRREALQLAALASVAACIDGRRPLPAPIGGIACRAAPPRVVDYVVVGSGAGGGPLACNLARAGYRVVLLEAGGDPATWTREIPALHAQSAEDEAMRWDFWVRTYGSAEQQKKNERWDAEHGGILYPRAGTLGGCTAHNALITLRPHDSDWNAIADTFGDESWRASNMRKYWRRLEHCDYAATSHASGHGSNGWLHTDVSHVALAFGDDRLRGIVYAAIQEAARIAPSLYGDAASQVLAGRALWDPNDDRVVSAAGEGMVFVPLHMNGGTRESARDYIRATTARCDNLHVELGALATRVLFDGTRAVGVEYLAGTNLYRACAKPDSRAAELREIHVAREVILAGGVFNSPQLLMLSGIGAAKDLAAHGIESRADRPGVGQNLQDRYEMTAVYELDGDLDVLDGVRLAPPDPRHPDPAFEKWKKTRNGPYASNGVVGAIVRKSKPSLATPDLFVFGIVGNFHGYFRDYGKQLSVDHKHFSWAVLKAHTMNRAGEVRLRSADPRDTPLVDFHYFDEGSPGSHDDVEAVVEGVMTGRRIMKRFGQAREVRPGQHFGSRRDLAAYIRDNAWGHHASCTNKMGPASDPMAVVDRDFRVHGTTNLRVVDASVFPRIPGFFVVAPVFMLAEKATDAILADAVNKGST